MQTDLIPYNDETTLFEGFAAYSPNEKKPVVILCHAWAGRDEFICHQAKLIAEWGYAGFALDLYGKGILGKSKEENAALKAPFLEDRSLLKRRLRNALETVYSLPYIDVSRVAVLGFGFGGLCALDFARSGADIKGAISIYGHFDPPHNLPKNLIKAKILILHGNEDPIASPKDLIEFGKEMDEAQVDWQAHLYSNTMHAFPNPHARDPLHGIAYNQKSAKRASLSVKNFLDEIFFQH